MTEQSVSDSQPDSRTTAPTSPPAGSPLVKPPTVSIVDDILDLDELMSADVRRAEGTARFALRPDLEADIDDLDHELAMLTDRQGNQRAAVDQAVAEIGDDEAPVRTAYDVALEIETKRAEYAASFRSVRMRQVPDDEWLAFEAKWKKALAGDPPYPIEMWNELIAMSAFLPKIPLEKLPAMRKQLGHPPMDALGKRAWEVNANAGVSVPKSQRSSLVLSRAALTQS